MKPAVLALPGNDALADALAAGLGERAIVEIRSFPDGETYVRLDAPVAGREVILACTLDRPDAKTVPLLLVAATARDLGASRVGMVAPYLAYMRQDARFHAGEGITSAYFAAMLTRGIDWVVTVDPHLHRYGSLAELYALPSLAVPAAPLVASWIRAHVERPVVIGPDAESAQWVNATADEVGAPVLVLSKVRRGDRQVEVRVPDGTNWREHTPVLVDDIISSGQTMVTAVRQLRDRGALRPVCLAIHGIFANAAYEDLQAAGARVVTCNTVPHPSNAIDVHPALVCGVRRLLHQGAP